MSFWLNLSLISFLITLTTIIQKNFSKILNYALQNTQNTQKKFPFSFLLLPPSPQPTTTFATARQLFRCRQKFFFLSLLPVPFPLLLPLPLPSPTFPSPSSSPFPVARPDAMPIRSPLIFCIDGLGHNQFSCSKVA